MITDHFGHSLIIRQRMIGVEEERKVGDDHRNNEEKREEKLDKIWGRHYGTDEKGKIGKIIIKFRKLYKILNILIEKNFKIDE